MSRRTDSVGGIGGNSVSYILFDMNQSRHLLFLHRLACLAAISVILVGILVLVGWKNDIPALYQVAPDLPPMSPATAFSFIFTGMALLLLQPEKPGAFQLMVGQVLAVGGILLGLLMLLKFVSREAATAFESLMSVVGLSTLSSLPSSPQTGLAFILTSAGLLLLSLNRPKLVNVAQWSALFSVMALVVVFFGYAHKENMFYVFADDVGIALHTATAFALTGWGIILAKVEKGFFSIMASNGAGGLVVRRVIILMALFPPLLGWLPVLLHSSWLTHTQVESMLAAVMVLIVVAMVIRLAYRLEAEETLRTSAEKSARQHQADLAHMVRLNIMGEMASGIAHELNQPLAAVANYAGACQRMIHAGQDAQRLLEPLDGIQKQARRASEIIRRLRAFVRKQQPHKVQTSLEHVIHEALLLIKTSGGKHNIPLMLELSDSVPDIKMDAIQIEQVILNIVQNAVDAMNETASQCRQVMVRSFVNPEGMVQVNITDTGPGMDAELKERIFDAFVTTKGQKGMGIGLSLCRSIIEAHGGRLWVESEAGQGATFSFTLPVE